MRKLTRNDRVQVLDEKLAAKIKQIPEDRRYGVIERAVKLVTLNPCFVECPACGHKKLEAEYQYGVRSCRMCRYKEEQVKACHEVKSMAIGACAKAVV